MEGLIFGILRYISLVLHKIRFVFKTHNLITMNITEAV